MEGRQRSAAALERISRSDHDRLVGAEIRRRIAGLPVFRVCTKPIRLAHVAEVIDQALTAGA